MEWEITVREVKDCMKMIGEQKGWRRGYRNEKRREEEKIALAIIAGIEGMELTRQEKLAIVQVELARQRVGGKQSGMNDEVNNEVKVKREMREVVEGAENARDMTKEQKEDVVNMLWEMGKNGTREEAYRIMREEYPTHFPPN
jgi:hypothetical protein